MSGSRSPITTVGELVAALTTYRPEVAVRLAVAPGTPKPPPSARSRAVLLTATTTGREPETGGERVVWIGEGAQMGYLPEIARNALGHAWS